MKKEQPLGKAFSDAPLHDPTPFGKGAPGFIANEVHHATNVLTPRGPMAPPYRAAKTAANGNRGRQQAYKGK